MDQHDLLRLVVERPQIIFRSAFALNCLGHGILQSTLRLVAAHHLGATVAAWRQWWDACLEFSEEISMYCLAEFSLVCCPQVTSGPIHMSGGADMNKLRWLAVT